MFTLATCLCPTSAESSGGQHKHMGCQPITIEGMFLHAVQPDRWGSQVGLPRRGLNEQSFAAAAAHQFLQTLHCCRQTVICQEPLPRCRLAAAAITAVKKLLGPARSHVLLGCFDHQQEATLLKKDAQPLWRSVLNNVPQAV